MTRSVFDPRFYNPGGGLTHHYAAVVNAVCDTCSGSAAHIAEVRHIADAVQEGMAGCRRVSLPHDLSGVVNAVRTTVVPAEGAEVLHHSPAEKERVGCCAGRI